MTYRLAKKRTLQKAGFLHVAGWLEKSDACKVQEKIEATADKVKSALIDKGVAE
jgi:hypothetical protein